jgi:hypothetical protein
MPRGNPQNFDKVRTSEEARKRGRAGGIKSGQVRRERKTLRDELLALLSAGDTQKDMNLALIQRALDGDTKAYEVVRDTIGEKPVDKIVVAEVDQAVINEVEAMLNDED